MERLALEIFDLSDAVASVTARGSKFANLPSDASITITETSEVFASGDVWSLPFTLNIHANAHIFGTVGDIHGGRLHEQVNNRRARLWVDGNPLFLGYLKLGDEVEVDRNGDVDMTFESGQHTFDDMIDGAKANQVPLMSDVQIGVALWRKRKVKFRAKLTVEATYTNDNYSGSGNILTSSGSDEILFVADGEKDGESVQMYPRMVFPKGRFKDIATGTTVSVNTLNTDFPYDDAHPYCNTALCYQKYDFKRTDKDGNETVDYSADPEAQRGYEYMPANRVNSAPNFFVLYWVDALMKHLGIHIEENQMKDVEDLRRLFFVNTNCAYRVPKKVRGSDYDSGYTRYRFLADQWYLPEHYAPEKVVNKEESGFAISGVDMSMHPEVKKFTVKVADVLPWNEEEKNYYVENNNYLHDAFATSECFPNADIKDVVKALESGFGARFIFCDGYQRVRILLLRNIFRSGDVQDISCEIVDDDVKVENSVRGFRMTYGKNTDTHFYYKGFDDKLPKKKPYFIDDGDKHDYSHWNLNAKYEEIINRVSAFGMTCHVTPNTGNAYIIKVDKDAKRLRDLHPSLFEGAGFMDAEDGDCTGEEDTVNTVDAGFSPVIMNDLNMDQERDGEYSQRFALFVDEEMRPRRTDLEDGQNYNASDAVYDVNGKLYAKDGDGQYVYNRIMADDGIVKPGEFAITSDTTAGAEELDATVMGLIGIFPQIDILRSFSIDGHVNEGFRLYLQDNFEPNDDGISPIEKKDWGLTLGVMRGSGSDAYVNYWRDPDDGEDNDTWDIMAGSSVTSHPDTCDNYGNEWDYDGSYVVTPSEAAPKLREMFPFSDAPFYNQTLGHVTGTQRIYVRDGDGRQRSVLLATEYSRAGVTVTNSGDIRYFVNLTLEALQEVSRTSRHMIVEVDSSDERGNTLVQLCKLAYGGGTEPMVIDNGVGSRYGRFSLKLRAEKPNPYFDPTKAESSYNRRYLAVTNENLRQRGLADQFYKEYSYWIRNARIVKRTVRMELAQMLRIDKTKRVTVGDVTGFIRKMQYSVDNLSGLGNVTMEIMYI